jgi:trans-2,3-dihydro-3-hydroxyanthranilate isomerase
MPLEYHVVDVFAERRLAGNPLTVVLGAGHLGTDEMQAIARETNHSETTFVRSDGPRDGAWPVRIFTPTVEMPFAGHPTLGTAAVLRAVHGSGVPLDLDLKVGRIAVRAEGDVLWMQQPAPVILGEADREAMAACLGLAAEDLDPRFPVESVSCGVPIHIVPLRSLDAARRASLDLARYLATVATAQTRGAVLVFAPETVDPAARLHVRCFTGVFGIPEDPATGGANGPLAAYLSMHRVLGSDRVDLAVEQGVEIGRPSRLYLRAWPTPGGTEVHVGGRVVPVARGTFL